ncbi:hypothetical protein HPB47_004160, partial [Ixodes persulcatus]
RHDNKLGCAQEIQAPQRRSALDLWSQIDGSARTSEIKSSFSLARAFFAGAIFLEWVSEIQASGFPPPGPVFLFVPPDPVNNEVEPPPTPFYFRRANGGEEVASSPAFTLLKWKEVGGSSASSLTFPAFRHWWRRLNRLLRVLQSLGTPRELQRSTEALQMARVLTWHIKVGVPPADLQVVCGPLRPSVGHSRRLCKILRSEVWRQARFFKDCLKSTCLSGQGSSCGRWRTYQDFLKAAEGVTEFLWQRTRPFLPKKERRSSADPCPVMTMGEPSALPAAVGQVLAKGPKFALQPDLKAPELVSLVRTVADRVGEEEKPRCVSEGVDCLVRSHGKNGRTVNLTSVVDSLVDLNLSVLVSDKEGSFVVLPKGEFRDKARLALEKNFREKVKEEAKVLCDRLDLKSLGSLVNRSKGMNLDAFFTAKTHKAGWPFRVIVTERGSWQRAVAGFLQKQLSTLSISTPSGHLAVHCDRCGCSPAFGDTNILGTYKEQRAREILEAFQIASRGEGCISQPSLALTEAELAARVLTWHIKVGVPPADLQVVCGPLRPSVGHSRRLCKILRSEVWRQARFFKDCLKSTCLSGQGSSCGRWRTYQDFFKAAEGVTEFLWQRTRPFLPKKERRSSADPCPVMTMVLAKGPKFALQPDLKAPELVSLVRTVADRVGEEEKPRCVSEGVDCLVRSHGKNGRTVNLTSVVDSLVDLNLSVLVSDKEGSFVVLPKGDLGSLVNRSKGMNLDAFFTAKTHKAGWPFRVIVTERGSWQRAVAGFLQKQLSTLSI